MRFCMLLLLLALLFTGCSGVADVPDGDIGIIGGADGPTAIFVAGGDILWLGIGALLLVAAVILAIVFVTNYRKK